jgi:hypothetical protein
MAAMSDDNPTSSWQQIGKDVSEELLKEADKAL